MVRMGCCGGSEGAAAPSDLSDDLASVGEHGGGFRSNAP